MYDFTGALIALFVMGIIAGIIGWEILQWLFSHIDIVFSWS